MAELYKCPICGETIEDDSFEDSMCDNCFWENDPVQLRNPDYTGGANKMSLNQARKAWKNGEKIY